MKKNLSTNIFGIILPVFCSDIHIRILFQKAYIPHASSWGFVFYRIANPFFSGKYSTDGEGIGRLTSGKRDTSHRQVMKQDGCPQATEYALKLGFTPNSYRGGLGQLRRGTHPQAERVGDTLLRRSCVLPQRRNLSLYREKVVFEFLWGLGRSPKKK